MLTEPSCATGASIHRFPSKASAAASPGESLLSALLREHVSLTSRTLQRGEILFDSGDPFSALHVVSAGSFKSLSMAPQGQQRIGALHLPHDWLGFEGIASGRHGWRAEALAPARVSSVVYEDLLRAAGVHPHLLRRLHAEMGREMEQGRLQKTELRGQPTETRICRFLLRWIDRCEIADCHGAVVAHLPLARAEIGELLGMTVESVSRAMSRLLRGGVIEFPEGKHRDIRVLNMAALRALAQPAHNAVSGSAQPHRLTLSPLAP
jgi:CRP/FNR family transcriptional regulator, anaerobic regulatory protein